MKTVEEVQDTNFHQQAFN